ncbi:Putative L,D-transpeptidase YkuD [Bacillus sp. THAF10]|uniref:L,D-transpeptidase n=1 Tax=Bacillus sp. THAF10 TaxID=2587848 RepID=UPI001268609D|nr:L,D-transpeptidase [Bacillus sp. THAF10]QFT89699.1 Putative L,D-transpeptidase YkuD [Bacillus sp. THAF10]
MFLFSLIFALVTSPLWPLGPNPLPGDPYIIVNKQTNQLAYFQGEELKEVHLVATGKSEDLTPEGEFNIIVKAINPYYRKKDIAGGDKKNPLGTRWIGFDAENTDGRTYGVHGTNRPDTIGGYVTQGCIRLENKHVEELFNKVPVGTKIWVVKSWKSFEELGKEKGVMK